MRGRGRSAHGDSGLAPLPPPLIAGPHALHPHKPMPLVTPWPGPLGKESLSPGCSEVDRGAGQALDGSAAPCPAGTGCSQSGARTRGGALLPGTKGVLVLGYPYQLSSRRGPPPTPGAPSSGLWGFRIYTDTPALCLSPGPDGEGGLVQMGWTWLCPSGLGGKPAGTACPLGKLKVTHPLPWGPPASHYPAPHRPRCTRAHAPTPEVLGLRVASPVVGPGRPSCPRLCREAFVGRREGLASSELPIS